MQASSVNQKNCPACATPMRAIKATSTYGSPVFVNQCKSCGGLWFDDLEIYRIKLGEANSIEGVDKEKLLSKTNLPKKELHCPNDNSILNKFHDPLFPASLNISDCPTCGGFWLNRGEFVEFQDHRKKVIEKNNIERSKTSTEDEEFNKQIRDMLAVHSISSDLSNNFARFLSTPLDPLTLKPIHSSDMSEKTNVAVDMAFGVLKLIFSLLLRS